MENQPRLQISADAEIRGSDKHGSGYYGAPRGKRKHKGIDLVCVGGTLILSPVDGVITRTDGIVYSDPKKLKYRYVEITDSEAVHCRFFYVKQLDIDLGLKVKRGDVIGAAQGVEFLYEGITPHIHFEARLDKKTYLDPLEYLRGLE